MVREKPLSGGNKTTAAAPEAATGGADHTASVDKPSPRRPCLVVGIGASAGGETSREMLTRQLEEQLRVTHERLQSTSEKLETSNEELQALNEELIRVNTELQGKVEELNQATSNMENLLASSGIATIFLDRELHVKGFTPAVTDLFNLIPADIGRPFLHVAGKIDWTTLSRDAETVLTGQPCAEEEITNLEKGRCYLKRIFPYRTRNGSIDGIVVTFIDITERKRAEGALQESEERIRRKLDSIISPEGDIGNLDLADIIDARSLQSLLDDFYELTGMPMGLLDIKGKVLVGVGWQDVCTKFHRVNPDTCRNCVESDVRLSAGVPHGEYKIYKCKNNMWDVATPVMVGDRHFGNLFMGQFFFADEPLDYELFRSQARKYGFDQQKYITALEAAPRMSRETLNTSMSFFLKLADILSMQSYSNLNLARSLAERDALMESLRENEKRLNRAQEISHLGSWELDLVKNRLTWSDEVYRIFGLQPQEFDASYEAFLEAVHPEDRAAVDAAYSSSLSEGRDSYEIEHRIVRKSSGETRVIHEKCEHIRDESGRIVRSVGMVHDFSERKQAEKELRRSKEEWELTFNSVPDLIAIIDDRHRVARVNLAMAEKIGRKPEDCLGLTCFEAIHDSNLPPSFCPHSRTMADGGEHHAELHEERLGGDYLVSTTPLLDSQGRMSGTVHVARDITERKRAEEELRRAKESAEAATRAKSQFLANMSHELRTPMTGVLGMLDLVLAGELDEQQRDFLCAAHNSARSLLRIINDILDLTKVEAGKLTLEEQPFSPRECLTSVIDILTPEARRKGLELTQTVAVDVPEAMAGDQTRLRQILINLCGNAVKFTDHGKVEVRVTVGDAQSGGRRMLIFTVTDTGIGIPAEKRAILFQAFSQVDDSNTRRYGGTGLGLAICREIVECMGGTMDFNSEPGTGSSFTFSVPFGEATMEHGPVVTAETPAAAESSAGYTSDGKKIRLLLAEDDLVIRHLLEVMLRMSKFELDIAENGQKAVEMWEKGGYDLILMDVQMPLMDGFAATRAIREKEQARGGHTLIVAMTAHALKQDEERCLEAGMDAYISKPVDLKASVALIKDLISKRDRKDLNPQA